jgi:chromosome segregation ATPase
MNESPITVTYSLEEVLTRLENKLDKRFEQIERKIDHIQEDITELKLGQVKLTEKVEGMNNRLIVVERTQKNQVWTLIILLMGTIAIAYAKLLGIIGNS